MVKKENMKKILVGLSLIFAAGTANADYCWNEKITMLIQQDGGEIYFTTDKSCPGWCSLQLPSVDAQKRADAMLMTAVASGKLVSFYWPAPAANCSVVPTYTKPNSVILMQ